VFSALPQLVCFFRSYSGLHCNTKRLPKSSFWRMLARS